MSSATTHIPFIVLVLIPVVIAVGIPLTGPMTARMSGWAGLARVYAADRECKGFKLIGRRGRFGKWMGYKGVLDYGVDDQGFYLSIAWLFKVGHPPMFFPWSEIQVREERMWFRDWVVLEFLQVPGVTFALHHHDARILDKQGGKFGTRPKA
ncbi:MAG TPA: hypothetical protein VHE12_01705 [bacterium]|nr:hypothetical protein [bacterium]